MNELQGIKKKLEKCIQNYPEGKIHILRSKKRVQFYLRMNPSEKSGEYISKKQVDIIRVYLQKKYVYDVLKLVRREIDILERVKKQSCNNSIFMSDRIRKTYSDYPEEIKQYIAPIDISDEDYINMWQSKAYQKKEVSEPIPEYITDKGERVRSKSELNIANALFKNRIPYKYECPVILSNGITVHPDFTVLDIERRKEIYWEHRGMMDDRYYVKQAVQKQKEYSKNGIIIGDNLIITEETSNLPLGTDEIQSIISFFLNHR